MSIVIPVYNKEPHLDRSIRSVLAQTELDFELILIDDASTDGSYERLLTFDDDRIRVIRRDRPGPGGYAARNLGVGEASHDWICFLDADDEWHPQFLEAVDRGRRAHPGVEVVATGWVEGGSADAPIWSPLIEGDEDLVPFGLIDYLRQQSILNTISITMSRDLFQRAGGYPTDDRATRGGDIDTYVRCLWHARRCVRIDQTLAFYYRDSVNRVTDLTRDPRPVIPALSSLEALRVQTDDRELRAAMDQFTNSLIYTRLWRAVSMGLPVDLSLLRRMNLSTYSASRAAKLASHRVRVKLSPRYRERVRRSTV